MLGLVDYPTSLVSILGPGTKWGMACVEYHGTAHSNLVGVPAGCGTSRRLAKIGTKGGEEAIGMIGKFSW